jgi:hypothetical protein
VDIEDEVSVGGDVAGEAVFAVAEVTRDIQSGLLANFHLGDTLVPTLDDLPYADPDIEITSADRGIKPAVELVSKKTRQPPCTGSGSRGVGCILVALLVRLAGVLEPPSILNGDRLTLLGLRSGALLRGCFGDAHGEGL